VSPAPPVRLSPAALPQPREVAPPTIMARVHNDIHGSEWMVFEHSWHRSHVAEEARWLEVVNEWLRRYDQA